MKQLAKHLLQRIALALPWGARRAIFDALCEEEGRYQLLMRLAAEQNVRSFGVRGVYGELLGSSADGSILKEYAENGVWAARTVALTSRFLNKAGGTYIDVGANIGATIIPVAQNPHVTCVALEPEPINHRHLLQNIAANCPHDNIKAMQVAAYFEHGSMQFETSPSNMGDNRLRLSNQVGALGEEKWRTIKVQTAPLDDIIPELSEPLVIKIDTQGAEPFVIAGGKRVVGHADLLIMEFSPYMMKRMGADQSEMLDFLQNQFSHISIALGEEQPIPEPMPSRQACEFLSNLKVSPQVYVDIVTGHRVRDALATDAGAHSLSLPVNA